MLHGANRMAFVVLFSQMLSQPRLCSEVFHSDGCFVGVELFCRSSDWKKATLSAWMGLRAVADLWYHIHRVQLSFFFFVGVFCLCLYGDFLKPFLQPKNNGGLSVSALGTWEASCTIAQRGADSE